MVEHWPHHPKVEGSSLAAAAANGWEKMAKMTLKFICRKIILFTNLANLTAITLWYYYFEIKIQLTRINLCIYLPLWCQNYLESMSLWRRILPPYFWIWYFNLVNLMFVLFKHVFLRWINYLEIWFRSDNMSCYYTAIKLVRLQM